MEKFSKNSFLPYLVTLVDRLVFFLKFMFSARFRQKEGLPWLRQILKANKALLKKELNDSEEMLIILWKYAHGKKISSDERKIAKDQLLHIAKFIPALAIFLLPGGLFILPFMARALPWDIFPSSFQRKKKKLKKLS